MELFVDQRETIKQIFKNKNHLWVKYKNLELGDYLFTYNGDPVIIIERKTITDLASSIKDGRYREQKKRLLHNYPKNKILYILEGDLTVPNKSYNFNKVDKYTIYSSLINMYTRDNLNVFISANENTTVELLENIAKKIDKQGISFIENKVCYDKCLTDTVKIVKGDNISEDVVYRMQLCNIPSISSKYANTIMSQFPTMTDLIINLNLLNTDEKIERIKNLECKKDEKSRKLGKKVAVNLIKYLFRIELS